MRDFKVKADQERNKEKSAHYHALMKFYQVQLERMVQARIIEESLPSTFNIEFVPDELENSVSSRQLDAAVGDGDDPVVEQVHIDSELCEFLEREM